MADTAWHAVVVRPAFASNGGPRIAIDAAHRNFHTVDGGYRPLAELLRADGFRVTGNERRFDSASLRGLDVLIIANARGALGPGAVDASAFTPEEISALRDWIRGGGSLLLVADHAPFGAAAAALGNAFGVEMSQGVTMDTTRSHPGNRSFLRFSRSQGDLGDHRILSGRDSSERISEVMTFSGQSLSLPKAAAPLLKLSASAEDLPPPSRAEADARAQRLKALRDSLAAARRSDTVRGDSVFVLRDSTRRGMRGVPKTAAGRVQGLAFREGRGRVVILGEAAALSAQVIDIPGLPRTRMGMNVPGNDNQQFALNVVRWLARVLD